MCAISITWSLQSAFYFFIFVLSFNLTRSCDRRSHTKPKSNWSFTKSCFSIQNIGTGQVQYITASIWNISVWIFNEICVQGQVRVTLCSMSCHNISRVPLLTTWNWTLLEKPPVPQVLKNFSEFYGTRRFIAVFTRAPPLVPILIQANPVTLRSILIVCAHLHVGLPSGLFPSAFHTNILYAFLFSPIRATCLSRLIQLYFIVLIILGEE
jgi:hypothetical protein